MLPQRTLARLADPCSVLLAYTVLVSTYVHHIGVLYLALQELKVGWSPWLGLLGKLTRAVYIRVSDLNV